MASIFRRALARVLELHAWRSPKSATALESTLHFLAERFAGRQRGGLDVFVKRFLQSDRQGRSISPC